MITDLSDHDKAIWAFTTAGMRTVTTHVPIYSPQNSLRSSSSAMNHEAKPGQDSDDLVAR